MRFEIHNLDTELNSLGFTILTNLTEVHRH